MTADQHSEPTPGPWAWLPTADDPDTHSELLPAGYFVGEVDSILHHGADWPMKLADMEQIAAAPDTAAERDRLEAANGELRRLVQTLLDNDPDDDVAAGMTVWDVWRFDARAILAKHGDPS